MTVPVLDGNGTLVFFDADGVGSQADPYKMRPASPAAGEVKKIFSRRLDLVGDGSGAFNQAVDGSVTPQLFRIKPAPGEIIRLSRIIVFVQDGGTFDSDKWGNGVTMTNGIEFVKKQGGVEECCEQYRTKTSGDMSAVCFDYSHVIHGSGDEYGMWRYTYEKSGYPIRLVGDDGDEYWMAINDDLTGLTYQYGTVQGHYE